MPYLPSPISVNNFSILYDIFSRFFYCTLSFFFFSFVHSTCLGGVIHSPQFDITHFFIASPSSEPHLLIWLTISLPFITLPKTTCWPFSHGLLIVVIKNYELFSSVSPQLAMERTYSSWGWIKFSSLNLYPYMPSPPVPSPLVISPP